MTNRSMETKRLGCGACGEWLTYSGRGSTLMATIASNDGTHQHDPNHVTLTYRCKNGHELSVPVRLKCSKCYWQGTANNNATFFDDGSINMENK